MRSRLADYFRRQREKQGLRLPDVARLVGYKNLGKGCNRIRRFEQYGEIHADLLCKLAEVLHIERVTIDSLIEQDRRAFFRLWNAWANQAIRPYLVIRRSAAVYIRREVPDDIQSLEEAETIAAGFARERGTKVCLVWSRRLSVWFDEAGRIQCIKEAVPGEANSPYLRLRGGRRGLLLQHPETGRTVLCLVDWPKRPVVTPSVSSTPSENEET